MNNAIFFFFYNLAHQSKIFDGIVIFFAVYFIYIAIILAGIFLLFYYKVLPSQNPVRELINKWKDFVPVGLSVVVAWFFNKFIAKILFHTLRPFVVFSQVRPLFGETGFAFPSGHSAVASALAFALFYINKKISYIFMLFALLIGVSRVISGVHFPIDILGGFIEGFIIAYLANRVTNFFFKTK
ncbi:MAG: phosphatase PAP2 family protein [Candidatus Pacebacteria bacterium]|nr:phosphatase PAP2 family protein [Candidatus Paceibacterota bacterium]